ncbi:MAG: leucyl aminopeptidase [Rickettsiales bacterium]|nr:leucyl aminopeptidase [Rickettsiales bacterium]OUV83292.1 MAG: leucyl aminopeptidase [Rickettsiales bacterium TMED131]
MKISFNSEFSNDRGTIVFVCVKNKPLHKYLATLDKKNNNYISKAMKVTNFDYKENNHLELILPLGSKANRLILIGTEVAKISNEVGLGKLGSFLTSITNNKKIKEVSLIIDHKLFKPSEVAIMLFGLSLNTYRFNKYFSDKNKTRVNYIQKINLFYSNKTDLQKEWKRFSSIKEGVFLTRDLVSEPANNLTPFLLAKEAMKLKNIGLKVEQLDEKKLKDLKMGALLGVAQGSENKPYVVTLEWKGNKSKKTTDFTFVGKGVTFDTGGISIKPSGGMEEMKYDMGGSAVVLGLMKALALRKTKANVSGVIGLVENMPSGKAQRPGDVVKSMSGQTIEVINTDAEGRLVLADILWYAQKKFKPNKIVDLATLTGAIIVSIGQEKAGMFSNNSNFSDEVTKLGLKVGEEVWNMPVDNSYEKDINSDIADMKNVGSGRGAGSTAGAIFLKRFIKDTTWMHLDIAGVTWAKSDRPMTPKGGSGFGVRLLDELVFKNFE